MNEPRKSLPIAIVAKVVGKHALVVGGMAAAATVAVDLYKIAKAEYGSSS